MSAIPCWRALDQAKGAAALSPSTRSSRRRRRRIATRLLTQPLAQSWQQFGIGQGVLGAQGLQRFARTSSSDSQAMPIGLTRIAAPLPQLWYGWRRRCRTRR